MGGTLVLSRAVNNHSHYVKRFTELGFKGVKLSAFRKDALRNQITDMKPDLIIMGARYYYCSTPYMMGELRKKFPDYRMAAVCLGEYPADLGMYFIVNGIDSYITSHDGIDQFYKGIEAIKNGGVHISPEAKKRLDARRDDIKKADSITKRRLEVIRLICNGFYEVEIADTLEISRNTVVNHRKEIFRSMNVRTAVELSKAAIDSELFTSEELVFRHSDYIINPLPEEKIKGRSKNVIKN